MRPYIVSKSYRTFALKNSPSLVPTFFKKIIDHPLYSLGPLWLLVQLYLWNRFGVHHHFDSHRYIGYADHFLATGKLPYSHEFWYLGYCLWLALFRFFTHAEWVIILGQVLLSGIAAAALYQATNLLSKSKVAAFFTTFLFISWFKGQWWNYYLLTESLFISTNILVFYFLAKWEFASWKQWMGFGVLVLWCFFVRPVGFLTVAGVLFYFIIKQLPSFLSNKKALYSAIPFLLFIGIAGFLLIDKMTNNYYLVVGMGQGEVICGIFDCEWVDNIQMPKNEGSMLTQMFTFIQQNIGAFFEMWGRRLWYYFGGLRSTISTAHNTFIALFLYPTYVLAMVGFFTKFDRPIKGFLMAFIIGNALMIAITCVNYNGRFLAPVLPFVFVLAGIGFNYILTRIKKTS